jgi:uncharacterized membrane protein YagU involved in acid resistance
MPIRKTNLQVITIVFLVAGSLDILAAFIHAYTKGVMPESVLKYIAGGIFGLKKSMTGGSAMAITGLALHYLIAFIFTAGFVLLYRNMKIISRFVIPTGLIYGLLAWTAMNYIVIPLSSLPNPPDFVFKNAIIGILILMLLFGLPISLITHYYLKDRNKHAGPV